MLALALFWLGRVGRSLRLLTRPPASYAGALADPDEDSVHFLSSDGHHRARVPRGQVASREEALADGAQATSRQGDANVTY